METVKIESKGKEFDLDVNAAATIQELKDAIDVKMGVDPPHQELYFLGLPLAEPQMQIRDFLEMSKTFNLVLPGEDADKRSPGVFPSDKEIFLITGKGSDLKTILLRANTKERVTLKTKRFGVVQDIEGQFGSRVFQTRIYEAKKEGSIFLRAVDRANKVFLESDEGSEELLTPIDTKKHDTSQTLVPTDHAKKILPILNTLASSITAENVPPATKLEKKYSCQLDVEFPETEAKRSDMLNRIELLIKGIQESDVDLQFIKEIIQEKNEEEYTFMDFLPSIDFKELPWSSVMFKAESLICGSTHLNFSLTFCEPPKNTEDISIYRVMELIVLTSIENLQFIKSVDVTEKTGDETLFLRMKSNVPNITNEFVERMLKELRAQLRLISGDSVAGHVATEEELDNILKSLLEQKGSQTEFLKELTPSSMRKLVKDSLITKRDMVQVKIEIVREDKSHKSVAKNIPTSSYWLFPYSFRKLSDLPTDVFNKLSKDLTTSLPTENQVWYKGFLRHLVGPNFSTSNMIEVMKSIVSKIWPYPEILNSYSEHEGTLGGLINALEKFESCVENQKEKEDIVDYKREIENIREKMYDEILLNMSCPSQLPYVKTMEEFEVMHRKLKLKLKTNEMSTFGRIKNDLMEGDQLWIFHKRRFMRSYAHVVIIIDGQKYVHVSSPRVKLMFRSRAIIREDNLSTIDDGENCFVVKPQADIEPIVCKERAKACCGIRF
eukprot:TRINITY_DN7720_c0_g1_i1.p1 TRINITY_DN7720_c0_g1~~TRINITY_DN7720_c0_g1_i1.p1  ORF type:complete len:722 (+),score=137.55 TRINITY_DN7720_c0_g1_i1:121-2286(+)